MTVIITPLSDADPYAVEALLDAAFGADRHTRTAYRIRMGMTSIPALSFAAFEAEKLVGTLQSWPVSIGETELTLVGPVAVAPDVQRGGIGRMLMTALIDTAPDAPMVCPIIDFVEETARNRQCSPNASWMACVSTTSLSRVAVPWALI